MPSRHPYDDVASTGGRDGFGNGVGRGLQENECRMRSNEFRTGHGPDVSFPFPDTRVDHSYHQMHDGRPWCHATIFPLDPHFTTGVLVHWECPGHSLIPIVLMPNPMDSRVVFLQMLHDSLVGHRKLDQHL